MKFLLWLEDSRVIQHEERSSHLSIDWLLSQTASQSSGKFSLSRSSKINPGSGLGITCLAKHMDQNGIKFCLGSEIGIHTVLAPTLKHPQTAIANGYREFQNLPARNKSKISRSDHKMHLRFSWTKLKQPVIRIDYSLHIFHIIIIAVKYL